MPRGKRETLEEKKGRAEAIVERLTQVFPEVHVPLHHRNPFELLVATILSAQSTDEQVNKITPKFFDHYPNPERLARAPLHEIEKLIHSLGLFRNKARSLKKCAQQLVKDYRRKVPSTMEELTHLAGVGRKTANVILGYAFGIPGIVVDTHCSRVSRRLGLTKNKEPNKIEKDLMALLPKEEWTPFSHRLIVHGRRVCHARKPNCQACFLSDLCPSAEIQPSRQRRGDLTNLPV